VPYFPPDEFDTPSVRAARDSEGKYYTVHADMSYKKWYDKYVNRALTDDEEGAISSYVSSISYIINGKLRDGEKLSTMEQTITNNLDSALNKLPVYEGAVYRSVSEFGIDNVQEFVDSHIPGKEKSFPEFLSSSITVYDESFSIQYVIKSKSGRDMRDFNAAESEILFKRNSKFKIIKVSGNTIYMEER